MPPPQLSAIPLQGDFAEQLPEAAGLPGRKLFLFMGSSLGNFSDTDALAFFRMVRSNLRADRSSAAAAAAADAGCAEMLAALMLAVLMLAALMTSHMTNQSKHIQPNPSAQVASHMTTSDRFLVGVDTPHSALKPPSTLEAAYNDARGVTAAFTINALRHVNRVAGLDFNWQVSRWSRRSRRRRASGGRQGHRWLPGPWSCGGAAWRLADPDGHGHVWPGMAAAGPAQG